MSTPTGKKPGDSERSSERTAAAKTAPTKTPASIPDTTIPTTAGIEVVELSEVDLDFTFEEMFQQRSVRAVESTSVESTTASDIASLELLRGVSDKDFKEFAAAGQMIQTVAGHVLISSGQLNNKVYFVIEGQLRLYTPSGDKRPVALVDVGHSTGLHSALAGQPARHTVIATEVSKVLEVSITVLDDFCKRSHEFARNYAALLASYVRGDNCLFIGVRAINTPKREGYVDELTLLHNQNWLDTILPRLIARFRLSGKPLAVVAFSPDQLGAVIKEHGIAAGLRVLQTVGHWLLDQTRPVDILAINKNGFFYAFLPDCDVEAALKLAVRLKLSIQKLPISLGSPKAPKPITTTLSFGIAQLEANMKDQQFLNKIDALVQKSRKLGGDQLSETL